MEQIDRASRLLYRDTDKVKTFNSSLLLSDVLEERRQQLEIKAAKADVLHHKEAAYFAQQQEELAVALSIEDERKEAKKARAMAQRASQLQQIEEMKANFLRDRAENKLEGQLIKQAAEEEFELNKTKLAAQHANAIAASRATDAANKQVCAPHS